MIEIKPPEEEAVDELAASQKNLVIETRPTRVEVSKIDMGIANELHELNKTLKEILREMRKRKA